MMARIILPGQAEGEILACNEPLSFWGGVDPRTSRVIDVHHPLAGQTLAGRILLLPGTRGSCTGSGVLLDMALNGRAPAALVFCENEDVATLGALVAAEMFDHPLPVLRVSSDTFEELSHARYARIMPNSIETEDGELALAPPAVDRLHMSATDRAMLAGEKGPAVALAMRILRAMAASQGAERLIDVTRGHIDGCIYASPANLIFAERMVELGARVSIPTTMNAISVDHANWRAQGVPVAFGSPAQRLADAYVRMGCQPSFTCAPYLLDTVPCRGEAVGWSESNAVIYANSVLGARTAKHPDFLDLCISITGRAPLVGPYLERNRVARRVIEIESPKGIDDAFWPLIGYLAGKAAPDRIPLLRGLVSNAPGPEALKALCASFGTTSAAPMLHVEGVTPEAHLCDPNADRVSIDLAMMREGWQLLNQGPEEIDLVAIGSPHACIEECHTLAELMTGRKARITTIVTLGRDVLEAIRADGTLSRLEEAGVQLVADLCWCSISEPVFPPQARTVMTNSGKYAHYGPGLSGRSVRFGSLAACAEAAATGYAPRSLPLWLN